MEERKKSRREIIIDNKFIALRDELINYVNESFDDSVKKLLTEYIDKRILKITDEKLVQMKPRIIAAVESDLGYVLSLPLSVKQVALLTGRTEACIYKMCQRGKLPYVKNGDVVNIYLRDINNMLLSNKR